MVNAVCCPVAALHFLRMNFRDGVATAEAFVEQRSVVERAVLASSAAEAVEEAEKVKLVAAVAEIVVVVSRNGVVLCFPEVYFSGANGLVAVRYLVKVISLSSVTLQRVTTLKEGE